MIRLAEQLREENVEGRGESGKFTTQTLKLVLIASLSWTQHIGYGMTTGYFRRHAYVHVITPLS